MARKNSSGKKATSAGPRHRAGGRGATHVPPPKPNDAKLRENNTDIDDAGELASLDYTRDQDTEASGGPHTPIEREIVILRKRLGSSYVYPATQPPGGSNRRVTPLPKVVGLRTLLDLFKGPSLLLEHELLGFLRGGGVLPQLFLWHQDCHKLFADNSESFQGRAHLLIPASLPKLKVSPEEGSSTDETSERIAESPWPEEDARKLAKRIACLAGMSREVMKEQETCEILLLCAEYTKSLRIKNMAGYFSKHRIPHDDVLLICSTILLAMCRDCKAKPDDGFFIILLGSRLVRSMPAALRETWEAKYPLPHDPSKTIQNKTLVPPETQATDSDVVRNKRRAAALEQAGVEPAMDRSADRLHSEEPLSEAQVQQEMREQAIGPNDLLRVGGEISRHESREGYFTHEQSGKARRNEAIFKSVKYAPDVHQNPFTDNEQLVYLEAFLEQTRLEEEKRMLLESKLLENKSSNAHAEELYANPIISFDLIAELLPRRSRRECIQHHGIMKTKLRACGDGVKTGKRPAEEAAEEARPEKRRVMDEGKPSPEGLSPPTYSRSMLNENAGDTDVQLTYDERFAEIVKQYAGELDEKDSLLQQEQKSHKQILTQLRSEMRAELKKERAEFKKELAEKDDELGKEQDLHASIISALEAEKDTALQQVKQSHGGDLAQLRDEMRKEFKQELAAKNDALKVQKNHALQQAKESHEEELNELLNRMRTDLDKKLAKKDIELQQQKDRYTLEISGFQAKLLKQAGGIHDVPSGDLEAAGHHTVDNEAPAQGDHVLQQEKVLHRKTITKLTEMVSLRDLKLAKIGADAGELLDNGKDHFFDEAYRLRALVEDMTEKAAKANKEINEAWSKCEEYGKDAEKGRETRDAAVEQKDLAESKLHDLKQDIQTTFDNQARRIADIDNRKSPENMTLAEEAYKSLKESIWNAESKQAGRIEALAKGQGPKELTFAESAIKNLYKRVQQLKDAMTERNVPIPPSRK